MIKLPFEYQEKIEDLRAEVERLKAELKTSQGIARSYGKIIDGLNKNIAALRSHQAAVPVGWLHEDGTFESNWNDSMDECWKKVVYAPQPIRPNEEGCTHNCNQGRSCVCK